MSQKMDIQSLHGVEANEAADAEITWTGENRYAALALGLLVPESMGLSDDIADVLRFECVQDSSDIDTGERLAVIVSLPKGMLEELAEQYLAMQASARH